MYPCNDIESPLRLSQHIPLKGDQLISYCMHEEMDFSQLNPPCKLKTVPALALGQEEGNYFYCDCEQFAGSSGSPLLEGNWIKGSVLLIIFRSPPPLRLFIMLFMLSPIFSVSGDKGTNILYNLQTLLLKNDRENRDH